MFKRFRLVTPEPSKKTQTKYTYIYIYKYRVDYRQSLTQHFQTPELLNIYNFSNFQLLDSSPTFLNFVWLRANTTLSYWSSPLLLCNSIVQFGSVERFTFVSLSTAKQSLMNCAINPPWCNQARRGVLDYPVGFADTCFLFSCPCYLRYTMTHFLHLTFFKNPICSSNEHRKLSK